MLLILCLEVFRDMDAHTRICSLRAQWDLQSQGVWFERLSRLQRAIECFMGLETTAHVSLTAQSCVCVIVVPTHMYFTCMNQLMMGPDD